MNLASLDFCLFAVFGVFLFHLLPGASWRHAVLTVLSLCFLPLQLGGIELLEIQTWLTFSPIVGFAVLGYASLFVVRGSRWRLGACLGGLVALFVYLKKYSIVAALPQPSFPLLTPGLSYILFRVIQIAVDYAQGDIEKRPGIGSYFRHVFSFYTFLSGPIWRYQEHEAQWRRLGDFRLSREDAYLDFSRFCNGMIKLLAFCAVLESTYKNALPRLLTAVDVGSWSFAWRYAAVAFCYLLFLYSNFSGYMDIMLGLGRLMGLTLPENFAYPLSCSNFLDLWSRWHITLSDWFKLYVFNPLMAGLTRRWGGKGRAPYLGAVAYFLTFFIMGLWHGSAWRFIGYGLFLGFAAAATKLWETWLTQMAGKERARRIRSHQLYTSAASGFTLAYFAIALTPLWCPRDFSIFLPQAGVLRPAVALLLLAAGLTLMKGGYAVFAWAISSIRARVSGAWLELGMVRQAHLGLRGFLVAGLLFDLTREVPHVVYMGF